MAWNGHGIRRPRRRRGDRRPPSAEAAGHAADRREEPPAADPWLVLNREIDRCRRYGHPLAIARVIAPEPPVSMSLAAPTRREGRPSRRRRNPLAELDSALRATLRSGDTTWAHGRDVFVLAPETDGCGAEAMGRRVRAAAEDLLGMPVDLRLAIFPEDGLTGHALRVRLTARERRHRGPAALPANGAGRPAWTVSRLAGAPAAPELRERAD